MTKIQLENVNLQLPIYNQSSFNMKSFLKKVTANQRFNTSHKILCFDALKDINLKLSDGDRLGLIGRNGSGKTTLMKVIAGLYGISSGTLKVKGKISCLFGTSFGMDPDATGYENIFLMGLFIGLSLKEIKNKIDDIIAFTELENQIYMPVRTYSAGMMARLSFAVSTCYEPDILIIDEGIGAGDKFFMEKMNIRLKEFMEKSRIMLLASHSEDLLKKFCTNGLLIEAGEIQEHASMANILKSYKNKTT